MLDRVPGFGKVILDMVITLDDRGHTGAARLEQLSAKPMAKSGSCRSWRTPVHSRVSSDAARPATMVPIYQDLQWI